MHVYLTLLRDFMRSCRPFRITSSNNGIVIWNNDFLINIYTHSDVIIPTYASPAFERLIMIYCILQIASSSLQHCCYAHRTRNNSYQTQRVHYYCLARHQVLLHFLFSYGWGNITHFDGLIVIAIAGRLICVIKRVTRFWAGTTQISVYRKTGSVRYCIFQWFNGCYEWNIFVDVFIQLSTVTGCVWHILPNAYIHIQIRTNWTESNLEIELYLHIHSHTNDM